MDPLVRLGEFAVGLTWNDIPVAVRRRARLALRDTVAALAAGAVTPAGRAATRSAAASPGAATVPGRRQVRTVPLLAAFAASVHASAFDIDDGHYRGGAIHPGSVVIPALLVAAESVDGIDAARLGTAQVVGYEVTLRAAHLLWPRHPLDDYHCTGTAATLGAAAAVAVLRGADPEVVARSIAIAWAHAPMSTFQLPMVKESIGWSAATGLVAADLAAAGFMRCDLSGAHSALDDTFPPTPFHRFGAMDDPFVASFGAVFEASNTYFKPYAACRYTHTALRTLRAFMDDGVGAGDVAAIDVHTPRPAMHLRDVAPRSLDHAQYSFPFVLATMLCTGRADAAALHPSTLADPKRLALARRVTVHHDPDLDPTYPQHYATRLVLSLNRRQQRFDATRLVAPGDLDDPMTDDDLHAKATGLLEVAGVADAAETSMALIGDDAVTVADGL